MFGSYIIPKTEKYAIFICKKFDVIRIFKWFQELFLQNYMWEVLVNDKNFYLDLVLYNRFLRCYVLIDFKVDELTHQDLGQMQMYVNYYDRYEIIEGENPTIGILMCKQSDEALVELTLPKDSHIYAKEYKLYLPDKKLLKEKLQEWIEEADW